MSDVPIGVLLGGLDSSLTQQLPRLQVAESKKLQSFQLV
jgi:asparagine synthetase B (glutamine-hydrolysing)